VCFFSLVRSSLGFKASHYIQLFQVRREWLE
jgi:hypothetical protein